MQGELQGPAICTACHSIASKLSPCASCRRLTLTATESGKPTGQADLQVVITDELVPTAAKIKVLGAGSEGLQDTSASFPQPAADSTLALDHTSSLEVLHSYTSRPVLVGRLVERHCSHTQRPHWCNISRMPDLLWVQGCSQCSGWRWTVTSSC